MVNATIKHKAFTPTDKEVTPKVTIVTHVKPKQLDFIEDDYLGPVPPPPILPKETLLEMEAGREALRRHAESRAAALAGNPPASTEPPEEIVKRDPTHVPSFNWTPEQQRARSV
jgi:hypothetical protein